MKYFQILILSAIPFIFACKTKKDAVEKEAISANAVSFPTDKAISFGNGGGFSGQTTEYRLNDEGLIEKRNGDSYSVVKQIDQEVCNQIFKSFESLELSSKRIDDPGNLYYFVNYRESDMMHGFTWGGINQKVDPALKNYYQLLWNLATKKATSVK